MKKFSQSFQIFLDFHNISRQRENYFSTEEKFYSIVIHSINNSPHGEITCVSGERVNK